MPSRRVLLGIGSNLGDRLMNLQQAVDALHAPDLEVEKVSSVYESKALTIDNEKHPDFLNIVVSAATRLDARVVWAKCIRIEWMLGRRGDRRRWQPRTIDIDILTLNDAQIDSDTLTIPHPRLRHRSFVVKPMEEILEKDELTEILGENADSVGPPIRLTNLGIKIPTFDDT